MTIYIKIGELSVKVSKSYIRRLVKEELNESRLRRHMMQKKSAPQISPREIQKIIKHPFMKHYLDAHFGAMSHDWRNAPADSGVTQNDLSEKELFDMIQNKLADDNRELTIAVVKKMMEDGTLGEEFLLAAGIR